MKTVTKALLVTAVFAVSATSAQAFFGPFNNGWGSPWSGSDTWGWGDVDASFRTTGWGRSSYYPYYGAPYYGAPYYGAPAPVAAAAPAASQPAAQ
jgi:hypothetical protein